MTNDESKNESRQPGKAESGEPSRGSHSGIANPIPSPQSPAPKKPGEFERNLASSKKHGGLEARGWGLGAGSWGLGAGDWQIINQTSSITNSCTPAIYEPAKS